MGLTGLEIYKQLPKKNCGECGPPTCLAFAMNLANGKATLDSCPYVTAEAKANLESASAPPITKVTVGVGEAAYELGDETELFRHDKKFYHETAMAFLVNDNEDIAAKVEKINGLTFHRVGLEYKTQFVAVKNASGDAASFKKAVETVVAGTKKALVLISEDVDAMTAAVEAVADKKPLIYAANGENYEKMTELAKAKNCPLAVVADGLNALAELVDKIVALGHKQLVLDPGARETSRAIADFTQIRRLAIKKRFRSFGFPIIAFTSEEEPMAEVNQVVNYVSKYASVVVLKTAEKAHILPLLSWRQNVYTDPQVPIRVEQKLHEVGAANENSPVYVTTNFSLTYYSVEGEVEASRVPSYIISVDTDGLSVLTAYADGKFEADKIAAVMKKLGVEEKVKHRNLVIPGSVAVLKGKLEEASGWNVMVGPREASGIVPFAKSNFA
ncbi:acetyl-CoA decarbonylase/synthase complex subunit gamma [Clostridiales bacterium PH28_bin88]|nr:acetyl-CoA decarbonylase/synthase complex subunit gamma [Clostridiales bacterium PH28_bin88]